MTETGTRQAAAVSPTEGGHPALVFLNTVSDDGKSRTVDTFDTGEALLEQLRAGDLTTTSDAPLGGQLHAILDLREAAYSVFSAIAAGRRPSREDGLTLETAIKSAIADASFSPGRDGSLFRPGPMGGLYDELVLGILDLLQSGAVSRLRECRRCTHLFIDRGRGPGRRWCSMARCGNRVKAQGFRDRRRASA
jgi:predicted RNA-binding Zn ribbon-like protein